MHIFFGEICIEKSNIFFCPRATLVPYDKIIVP